MMENLTHDETRIGHNRLKLVGIKNIMDGYQINSRGHPSF